MWLVVRKLHPNYPPTLPWMVIVLAVQLVDRVLLFFCCCCVLPPSNALLHCVQYEDAAADDDDGIDRRRALSGSGQENCVISHTE